MQKILTAGSREMMRTVLSAKPTARKRHLCSPGGTFASAIHTASDGISFRSVYSLSCPVCKQTSTLYKTQQLHNELKHHINFSSEHTQVITWSTVTYEDSTEMPKLTYEDSTEMPKLTYEDSTEMPKLTYKDCTERPKLTYEDSTEMPKLTYEDSTERPKLTYEDSTERPKLTYEDSTEMPKLTYEDITEMPKANLPKFHIVTVTTTIYKYMHLGC